MKNMIFSQCKWAWILVLVTYTMASGSVYHPLISWPDGDSAETTTSTNPEGNWAAYTQVKNSTYTDAYTLGEFLYLSADAKGWGSYGGGVRAFVRTTGGSAPRFYIWPESGAAGGMIALQFTVPDDFEGSAMEVNLSGTIVVPAVAATTEYDIYLLDSAGESATEIGTYTSGGSESISFDLNTIASAGDKIIFRASVVTSPASIITQLDNYTITLSQIPEPMTVAILCLGGTLSIMRRRNSR